MATTVVGTDVEAPQSQNGDAAIRAEKWASLVGRWTVKGPQATYEGPADSAVPTPYGVARSAHRFRDGIVSVQITLSRTEKTSGGILIGFQSIERPYVGIALGGFDRAYSIFEFRPDGRWELVEHAGLLSNLQSGHPYRLVVEVEGQKIRMTVDEVDVLETVLHRPVEGTGLCLYAYDTAQVVFDDVTLLRNPPKAFVVMPFSEPYDTLYRDVIKPVAESPELAFDIVRVDEVVGPGMILDDIRRQIEGAHIIVAEISSHNPNVFYELGYAHALRKPAVLLIRKDRMQDMPFDIRGYRAIPYDDTIGGKKAVEETLRRHLEALRRDS
jgi:hypothetical protein